MKAQGTGLGPTKANVGNVKSKDKLVKRLLAQYRELAKKQGLTKAKIRELKDSLHKKRPDQKIQTLFKEIDKLKQNSSKQKNNGSQANPYQKQKNKVKAALTTAALVPPTLFSLFMGSFDKGSKVDPGVQPEQGIVQYENGSKSDVKPKIKTQADLVRKIAEPEKKNKPSLEPDPEPDNDNDLDTKGGLTQKGATSTETSVKVGNGEFDDGRVSLIRANSVAIQEIDAQVSKLERAHKEQVYKLEEDYKEKVKNIRQQYSQVIASKNFAQDETSKLFPPEATGQAKVINPKFKDLGATSILNCNLSERDLRNIKSSGVLDVTAIGSTICADLSEANLITFNASLASFTTNHDAKGKGGVVVTSLPQYLGSGVTFSNINCGGYTSTFDFGHFKFQEDTFMSRRTFESICDNAVISYGADAIRTDNKKKKEAFVMNSLEQRGVVVDDNRVVNVEVASNALEQENTPSQALVGSIDFLFNSDGNGYTPVHYELEKLSKNFNKQKSLLTQDFKEQKEELHTKRDGLMEEINQSI